MTESFILAAPLSLQDLQHPNEFIRGSTLRFLCKLKEPELLEPLMPSIRACLEHRHAYVRRNAVLAIYTIYKYVLSGAKCIFHIWLISSSKFQWFPDLGDVYSLGFANVLELISTNIWVMNMSNSCTVLP